MTAVLIVIFGLLFLGGVTLFVSILLAPEGHEDAAGFHVKTPTRVTRLLRPLDKPVRESPSLNI